MLATLGLTKNSYSLVSPVGQFNGWYGQRNTLRSAWLWLLWAHMWTVCLRWMHVLICEDANGSSRSRKRGIPTSSGKWEADSHNDTTIENKFSMELTIDMGVQELGRRNLEMSYEKMDDLVIVLNARSWRMSNNTVNMGSKMNMVSSFSVMPTIYRGHLMQAPTTAIINTFALLDSTSDMATLVHTTLLLLSFSFLFDLTCLKSSLQNLFHWNNPQFFFIIKKNFILRLVRH